MLKVHIQPFLNLIHIMLNESKNEIILSGTDPVIRQLLICQCTHN